METFAGAVLLFAANLALYLGLSRRDFLRQAAVAYELISREDFRRKARVVDPPEP